jgi:hypothetical protein
VSVAAPGFLAAAFAVAAAVVALHLLVLRPPPASRLPTARFVPPAPSMVRRRETWPQDRWLLALRVATILLAGLAFSGPALGGRRTPSARIVALDLSAPAARDSARRYLGPGDVAIAFDTVARVVPADSILQPSHRSSLSSALIAARRAARQLRADSIELIVISPFATSAVDAATAPIRAQWPAAIRVVRVRQPPAPSKRAHVEWNPPAGAIDTIGGVVMDGVVAVAPFTRARTYRAPDGSVVARWVDGAPAAVERPVGDGCEREIAIGMPDTRAVDQLRAALTDRPCGAAESATAMSDSAVRAFAGAGVTGATFARDQGGSGDRTLMTTLLILAAALAIAEWVIRR